MAVSSRALMRSLHLRNLQTQPARYATVKRSATTTANTQADTDAAAGTSGARALPHDSLPRYPTASALGALRLSDYIGTASFAYSGSLLAAGCGMDVLGSTLVGTVTAVGGGTIRDAVILNKRPFWTDETEYLYICVATGCATFLAYSGSAPGVDREEGALEFLTDTLGVGAFCVIGAMNGARAGVPGVVCAACGMATATFGGVVRDVLCKRDVRILHSRAEIYATTAVAGAAAYLVAGRLGLSVGARVGSGVGLAVGLRAWAATNGVRLAVWERDDECQM